MGSSKGGGFPEHAWSIPVPFVLLLYSVGLFFLEVFDTELGYGSSPFLPYLLRISVDLSTVGVRKRNR